MNNKDSSLPTLAILFIDVQDPELMISLQMVKELSWEMFESFADLYFQPFRPFIMVGPSKKRLGWSMQIRLYSSIILSM